jgi:hypothetical protein
VNCARAFIARHLELTHPLRRLTAARGRLLLRRQARLATKEALMRRTVLIRGGVLLAVCASSTSEAVQQKVVGSDALYKLVPDIIAACPGAASLTYVGVQPGSSDGFIFIDDGFGAMQGLTSDGHLQHIAPMARQLTPTGTCSSTSRQLLIGLDSVSVLA